MPTPFTHLAAAAELLASPALPSEARAALQADWPAFLFGNTAPDVQTISGQSRAATHFFRVPLRGDPTAGPQLLAHYPSLAVRAALPPAQAAFICGYLAHLVYDQLWVRDLFQPYFGETPAWGTFHERLYLHNVLRAHVDAADLERLTPAVGACLRAAEPAGWLPFVDSHHLRAWRDLIADQLSSGAGRTVEVFAQRNRVDPQEFAALLASPQQMAARVFSRLPEGALAAYRVRALAASARTISRYWQAQPLPSQL
jgi:hypothetical protein